MKSMALGKREENSHAIVIIDFNAERSKRLNAAHRRIPTREEFMRLSIYEKIKWLEEN